MERAKHILMCLLVLGAAGAQADERIRPTHADQLNATKQTAVKVIGARVSYANYAALRRDFPQLKALNESQIDQWVLDNFAFINAEQEKFNQIRNSEIPLDKRVTKTDARPPGYGRAGVMSAEIDGQPAGLVDIKGLGIGNADKLAGQLADYAAAKGDPAKVDAIRTKDHSDGLMRHGEAIAELTRQTALQRLYDLHNHQHGTDFQTVESYFVIELPFDVLGPNGSRDRAALYGRQAHWRGTKAADGPPDHYSDDFGHKQGTVFGSAVDFGGVLIEDPRLKAKFTVKEGGRPKDPQDSLPWIYGHQTADGFRQGGARAVYTHLAQMLEGIDAEWAKLPPHDPKTLPAGKQKQYEDWGAVARKTKPTAHDVSEMVAALKRGNPTPGLADTWLVQQMSPPMLRGVFGQAVQLRELPPSTLVAAFPATAHGGTDPQVRTLLEAILEALPQDTISPRERSPLLALAASLVERHFPPSERAAALAPFEQRFLEKLRRDLTKEMPGHRLELLANALRDKAPLKDLRPLIAKELAFVDQNNARPSELGKMIAALVDRDPSRESFDLVREHFGYLDYQGRLAILKYFAPRKDLPPDLATLFRQNLGAGTQRIDEELLHQLSQLEDPTFKHWVVEQLAAPGMDANSVGALWQLAFRQQSNEALAPVILTALKNGTPNVETGMAMARILLKVGDPAATDAIDSWLRGLSGFQRGYIRNSVLADSARFPEYAQLAERARQLGTRPTCRDVYRGVRKMLRLIIGPR